MTGLNGLIGWNLFESLRERYETLGTFRKHHPGLGTEGLLRLEVDDEPGLAGAFDRLRPDYVMHAWAMCDLDLCEQMPEAAYRVNVEGTRKILRVCRNLPGLKKFVFISTDHVFGGEHGGYDENDLPRPKHVYGRTKFAAEQRVKDSGLPYLIIRPGLVIGSSLQGNKGPRDFLFSRIRSGKPTHLFLDEWRAPLQAKDLAGRVLELALGPETGIFHVAGEKTYSRFELGRRLARAFGLPTDQIFPRLRKEDPWARIRPRDISLKSRRIKPAPGIRGPEEETVLKQA